MTVQIIKFERLEYQELCEEMKGLLSLEKEITAKKVRLRDKIAKMAGGNRMEYGIKITHRSAQGSVDYKSLVTYLGISEPLVESYRKPEREYIEIRSY